MLWVAQGMGADGGMAKEKWTSVSFITLEKKIAKFTEVGNHTNNKVRIR